MSISSESQQLELAGMHVAVDDFTDPWTENNDVVILLHGIAEHGGVWRSWSPFLSRFALVVRPTLRGFVGSAPLPAKDDFGLSDWADDVEELIKSKFRGRKIHLIGRKLGALVAFELASRHPSWLKSITLAGMLASPSESLSKWVPEWCEVIRYSGVREWARMTMRGRMGNQLAKNAMEWWIDDMGKAPPDTVLRCFRMVTEITAPPCPESVNVPALFILGNSQKSAFKDKYNQQPTTEAMLALVNSMPCATVRYVKSDSYNIAATNPDDCARLAASFISSL